MKEVVILDTETTGLNKHIDRIIEMGAIKLRASRPISKFHTYLNAQGVRSSVGAVAIHGITDQFLQDKPVFLDVYTIFLAFINDTQLVIHNAPFDVGFLEAELSRVGYQAKLADIVEVVDTLVLAKQRFPGKKNNLDALCKRFGIANDHRTVHGALLDADLLAKVYGQLCVDQSDIFAEVGQAVGAEQLQLSTQAWCHPIQVHNATEEECHAHMCFFDQS